MARLLIGLWLTLILAIAAMVVLAQFWIQGRQASAGVRVQTILQTQLGPIDDAISRVVGDYSIGLQRQLANCQFGDLEQCVELSRYPLTHALVVVNEEGQLHFPTDPDRLSRERQSLLDEVLQLLREQIDPRPRRQLTNSISTPGNLMPTQGIQAPQQQALSPLRSKSYQTREIPQSGELSQAISFPTKSSAPLPQLADTAGEGINVTEGIDQFGWITWYHRRGMELGFWWHETANWRVMVVLPRARWMADIVASLPDMASQSASKFSRGKFAETPSLAGSLKQLVDVEGNVIYQWGDAPANLWANLQQNEPAAELVVSEPLDGWRLRVYATDELAQQLAGDAMLAPIWLAVGGISLALILGGLLLTVNLNRQMRLATSRVSFVNQVSHELRTPLTNICMYADLLAGDIAEDEAAGGQLDRISVIQNESRRLNRLISNVLEFARSGNRSKKIHWRECVLDDLIHEVLETFRPRLEELGFDVQVNLNTGETRSFDPDVVEQILVNLIGNAEKYAASGKWLSITTQGDAQQAEIRIQDAGPGIPARMAQRVFSPFERVSDRLEDPAGTGIGLTIVRELSRKHGGDCHLESAGQGALFCCTIAAPVATNRP